jgi:hypothetical protein
MRPAGSGAGQFGGSQMPNCAAGSSEVANERVHAGVRIGRDQKLKGLWILLLGCSDDPLDHHYEKHSSFVPSADPAHPPAINLITQSC